MSPAEIHEIPIDQIRWEKNVRTTLDEETLAGLARTLGEQGLQQPIQVIRDTGGNGFIGLLGQRRCLAHKLAGKTTIQAIILDKVLSEAEIVERQLVENMQREALNPIDQAVALDRLMKSGNLSAVEAAAKVGIGPASVSKALSLLSLPESIRLQVASGALSPSAAYELAKVNDAEEQAELAAQVVNGSLTRDALTGTVKAAKRKQTATTGTTTRVVAMLGEGRSVTVQGSALAWDSLIECLEQILTKARKSRTQGLTLATFSKMLKDQAKA